MENPYVEMWYTLADGKRVRLKVSVEVKNLMEHTDRRSRSQQRQERRRHMEYVDGLTDTATSLPTEDLADLIIRLDSYKRLHNAISMLSEVQRRRLLLYYFGGLTQRQIAALDGVALMTVANSIQQARKRLKYLLSQ